VKIKVNKDMWPFKKKKKGHGKQSPIIYAVGDVHGRQDLLAKLIGKIQKDRADREATVIFLGDYVDRGPDSAGVIEDLVQKQGLEGIKTVFLKGNHEATLLSFLKDSKVGPAWSKFGAIETLASYGVRPPMAKSDPHAWANAQQQLRDALPTPHLDFLNKLELNAQSGPYFFVHAGVDPYKPINEQTEAEYLWIREPFLKNNKKLSHIVVHGHSADAKPKRNKLRIGVDTGAYMTGHLTAARLQNSDVSFIAT
jgi:serine/threonine protein phosphatase 1